MYHSLFYRSAFGAHLHLHSFPTRRSSDLSTLRGMGELGMNTREFECCRRVLELPHGIVLVTGPTGSGKTSTLYTALNEIRSEEHTSELQSPDHLVCRLLPEKKNSRSSSQI